MTFRHHGEKVGGVTSGTRCDQDHAQRNFIGGWYNVDNDHRDDRQQNVLTKQSREQRFPVASKLIKMLRFNAQGNSKHNQGEADAEYYDAFRWVIDVYSFRFQCDKFMGAKDREV